MLTEVSVKAPFPSLQRPPHYAEPECRVYQNKKVRTVESKSLEFAFFISVQLRYFFINVLRIKKFRG